MWRAAALLLTALILRAHSRANVAADSLAMVSLVKKVIKLLCDVVGVFPLTGYTCARNRECYLM